MDLTPNTFNRFSDLEMMEKKLEIITDLNKDGTTFMWMLLPLSEKLGEKVFDVAAKSLKESGVEITAEKMKELARDMRLPEKQEFYRKKRLGFLKGMVTAVSPKSF